MKTLLTALLITTSVIAKAQLGIFNETADIGNPKLGGSAQYDARFGEYQLTGGGTNVWSSHDEFRFVYKKIKGDFIFNAETHLLGRGTDGHRKGGLMVRADLSDNAQMATAVTHGDLLSGFQYRPAKGSEVVSKISEITQADILQLERHGNTFTVKIAQKGDTLSTVSTAEIAMPDELYIGLFVCAHHAEQLEDATFRNVRIYRPAPDDFRPYRDYIGSHIEILDVFTEQRDILYSEKGSLQAPNWIPDNSGFIYNADGLIYKLKFGQSKPEVINTDFATRNNNDHVISWGGEMLGISSSSGEQEYGSLIYTLPFAGGVPKRITPTGPSYFHGWSPDNQWLTYTARRNGQWDVYKCKADGSEPEINLTKNEKYDDGSEYSPDGQYIYFNSVRTGHMQLWRMKPDGSEQTQLTFEENMNSWFPHISPDGRWIAFISYGDDIEPGDHPFYKHVTLRLMPTDLSAPPRVIAYLYGGQGTINTPSWSPDSRKILFVSNTIIE
ncbi:biopolymer transporter TolR [Jiulongibacter sediminis]|jgi:Tol biopolymer transport system component/regulation of enolase protein 1 (concanavalin A-like superfamily)|uniref:biopolymer transporter TolR n=1 Tax=Jiulongibacter sediminis TaxID=1605367 RepID=UPI0026EF436E|nr:biopolymer transporter TolR [Jiulongibacter sediminis]